MDFAQYLEPGDTEGTYYEQVRLMLKEGKTRLTINLNDLRKHDPALWKRFLEDPMKHIPPFEDAFNDYVKNSGESDFDIAKYDVGQKTFHLGFDGAFGSRRCDPKNLQSDNITNLMCVEGIVTRISLVRPKMVQTVHYAEKAEEGSKWKIQTYRDATSFRGEPTGSAYPTQTEDGHPLSTEFGLCTYEDNQTVFIQDMPERTRAGTMPRTVECILDRDLVDSCKPGDRVQMIGVYRTLANRVSGESAGQFKTVLIVNNVKIVQNDQQQAITGDDVKVIKKMSKKPDIFKTMARSIAPAIYGNDEVKRAILLMLLGGVEKNLKNGTHIRGDINILMVGDPSVAKSQFLRTVMNTAPLAINTTGRGASGVGLTAAVTQDRLSGERRLEAGAMVLADRGIVCIDEFDKMGDADRVAIHEVMEQQTVTIAKAGIHTSLNARCSVIAASNPVYGQYDKTRKPHENIALPDSLLSRFDLLFIMLDNLDKEIDTAISAHVLNLHRTRHDEFANLMYADMPDSDDEEERDATDIWEKSVQTGAAAALRNKRGEKQAFLKKDFCKKYIAYCKQKCRPVLTDEASELMAEKYAQLRDVEANGTLPITARCFETMIRLGAAHAKLRLSKRIEKKDVEAIMKILMFALKSSDTSQKEDEEMQANEDEDMEAEEEEEVEPAPAPRRSRRVREKRKQPDQPSPPPAPRRTRRPQKDPQKILVMRQLNAKFDSGTSGECTVDELMKFMKDNDREINREDLLKQLRQLDEEGKVFYVADDQKLHRIN